MTKMNQRPRNRSAYGELDEIVVQLFDDLAAEDDLPRSVASATTRAASSQRSVRPPDQRATPTSSLDSPQQRRDQGERLTSSKDLENEPNEAPRGGASEEFDIEQLFAEDSRVEKGAESLTPEDKKFIQDVVAWLAPRPNADLLLDRIEEDLWLKAVAGPRQGAVEKPHGDDSAASPAIVEEKPAEGGK